MARTTIDISGAPEALNILQSMSTKQMKPAYKATLRKCGNIVLKELRTGMRSRQVQQKGSYLRRYPGERPLNKVGRVDVTKDAEAVLVRMTRSDWMARILEVGSKGNRRTKGKATSSTTVSDRRYKNGGINRGQLQPLYLLPKAMDAGNSKVKETIDKELETQLKRRWMRIKR